MAVLTSWVPFMAALAAAWFAYLQASRAQRGADGIDRRRYRVESLDAQTESFRVAVTDYLQAIHLADGVSGEELETWRRTLFVKSLTLRGHPLCSVGLNHHVAVMTHNATGDPERIGFKLHDGALFPPGSGLDMLEAGLPGSLTNVLEAIRAVYGDQEQKRESELENAPRGRWWQRSPTTQGTDSARGSSEP